MLLRSLSMPGKAHQWLYKKWYIMHRLLLQAKQLASGKELRVPSTYLDKSSKDSPNVLAVAWRRLY